MPERSTRTPAAAGRQLAIGTGRNAWTGAGLPITPDEDGNQGDLFEAVAEAEREAQPAAEVCPVHGWTHRFRACEDAAGDPVETVADLRIPGTVPAAQPAAGYLTASEAAELRDAGRAAYDAGRPAAPWLDATVRRFAPDGPLVGARGPFAEVCEQFGAGYEAGRAEEVDALQCGLFGHQADASGRCEACGAPLVDPADVAEGREEIAADNAACA